MTSVVTVLTGKELVRRSVRNCVWKLLHESRQEDDGGLDYVIREERMIMRCLFELQLCDLLVD